MAMRTPGRRTSRSSTLGQLMIQACLTGLGSISDRWAAGTGQIPNCGGLHHVAFAPLSRRVIPVLLRRARLHPLRWSAVNGRRSYVSGFEAGKGRRGSITGCAGGPVPRGSASAEPHVGGFAYTEQRRTPQGLPHLANAPLRRGVVFKRDTTRMTRRSRS
jgi:hypothetical protein